MPVVSDKVTGQRSNLLHQTQLKERVTDRFPDVTLTNHRGQAMRKMGARSFADLVRMSEALGDRLEH